MSARAKKAPSTQREMTSPGVSPSSSQSPGRVRPPSPTMISRVQEKQELACLNDRLATYIDKVRQLENENNRLTRQIETREEVVSKEVSHIKSMYENELADARRLLDETAKDKAKLQIEVGKYRAELDDLKDKYGKVCAELQAAERRLMSAESQINDLQARLSDAVNQRKHFENEYNKLRKELDNLEKQLAAAKKQLEEETILRVDLQNKLQSLKEELAFRQQIHEQEMLETRTRTRVEIEQVDGRLHEEYETKLADALKRFREENDEMVRSSREETEAYFVKRLDELRNMVDRNDVLRESAQSELRKSRARVDELTAELSKLTAVIAGYERKIQDLEERIKRDQADHQAALNARDAEIRHLRQVLEDQLAEYRDLLDVKIQLDSEIAAYRKLLEVEETRLNISGTSSESATPRRTPVRSSVTPAGSRKRKRTLLEGDSSGLVGSYSDTTEGYSTSSTATGPVEVHETDVDGGFIKLHNTSDKDINLGGWQLKHIAGDNETTYKFHRALTIKADQDVAVWSSDSETTHNPPSDLVMKGQRWFTADSMKTILMNASNEEVASREMKRSAVRTTFARRTMATRGGIGDSEGGAIQDEKCLIM